MNVAICFFGHVKNFNDRLYESFINSIFLPLQSNCIDYYLVTYNNKKYFNPSSKENHDIDHESIATYFNFKNQIILDINADYTKNIDQFVYHTLDKIGYEWSWGDNAPLTTSYAIRQIYGLQKLYELLTSTNYNIYILCRPDCIFENKLQSSLLNRNENILIPNFNHWWGYNDRFAILDKYGLTTYCSRYIRLMSNPTVYHAEKYLKDTIDESNSTIYLFDNFRFRLLRANGELSRVDY